MRPNPNGLIKRLPKLLTVLPSPLPGERLFLTCFGRGSLGFTEKIVRSSDFVTVAVSGGAGCESFPTFPRLFKSENFAGKDLRVAGMAFSIMSLMTSKILMASSNFVSFVKNSLKGLRGKGLTFRLAKSGKKEVSTVTPIGGFGHGGKEAIPNRGDFEQGTGRV